MPTPTVRYVVDQPFATTDVGADEPYLTARDASLCAGVNERTIRRAIARGELAATRHQGQFRITATALQEYQRQRAERESAAHHGASTPHLSVPATLPVPATALIGRDRELETALAILAAPDGRLLTLTGPGGVGKTRLALAIAAAVAPNLADGAIFVNLETIREPELAIKAIAAALGVSANDGRSLLDTLADAVRQRRQLLVLDNFEHILPTASAVARFLAAGPELRLLVTSREALHLRGESELVVPPLALPDHCQAPTTTSIGRSPAVELFVRRARAVQPSFALSDENATVIAAVCQRLDGLPLAIELAAARIKHTTPTALLTRLERRLEVLTGGARDLPQRLQTMRAAIAWSYDLLTPQEQVLLRRLAVFSGGCTPAAVASVVFSDGGEEARARPDLVFDMLTSLVDKSLLRLQPVDAAPRFTMLETIREYAAEQLVASGEARATRARHAAYFLALAEDAAPRYHHPEEGEALSRLEIELANFRSALSWAAGGHGDAEAALRLANGLFWLWYVRGYHPEGWGWFDTLLARPESAAGPEARANALIHAGWLALRMGMAEPARSLMTEALARCHDLVLARSAAFARGSCGFVALVGFGDPVTATTFLEEGLLEAQAVQDGWLEAMANYGLSIVALARGDLPLARAMAEQSVKVSRCTGDSQGIAAGLAILGQLARFRGETEEALRIFAEALEHYQRVGDRGNVCTCVEALAGLQVTLGRPAQGAHLFGAAAALRQSIGTPVGLHEQQQYDADVAAARAALPEEVFTAAWREGEAASLREAVSGVAWSPPRTDSLESSAATSGTPAALNVLTRREREILELVSEGHTDRQISQLLSISPATVTKHVGNVLGKLGVNSRTAAAIALLTTMV